MADVTQTQTETDTQTGTAADGGNSTVDTFIGKVESEIINPLIILITIIGLAVFFWGVVTYIRNAANDEKRQQSQAGMLWGIVGLIIIFGGIAIVNILKNVAGFF